MSLNINQILRNNPRSSKYGAPMGARNTDQADTPLLLQRVSLVDGAYGPDGTYWGHPDDLWCAFNAEDGDYAAAMGTRIYVRANDRAAAIQAVLEDYDVTFKRN
jgi:hypothetical protein